MKRPFEAWRRSLPLWGLPFAFCLLNLLILSFYFAFYAGEVERLERGNEIAENDLREVRRRSEEIEAFLGRIETQGQKIRVLQREHFQTEAQRFTRAIQEVKELARDAGLNPTSFSYPQQVLEREGLIQRQIQFSVEGSYRQMRTFINFLELTDQFLTLNSVSLTEGGPDRLSIRLQLSTVFATEAPPPGSEPQEAELGAPQPHESPDPGPPELQQGPDPDAPASPGSAAGETT